MSLTLLTLTFNVSLIATVFAYALWANPEDLRYLLKRPRLLVLSMVTLFVLTPALALAIEETFDIPIVAKVAIVALSLSIIPPLLPQKVLKAGAEGSYAISLTLLSAILSIAIIPFQVHIIGELMDRPYGVPVREVAGVVVSLIALPLAVGTLVRRRWPSASEAIGVPMTRIAGLATAIALVVVLALTLPRVWDFLSFDIVLAMVAFNVGAVVIGHVMGGPERNQAIALGISCPSRHPAIAFTIATANYPGQNFVAAVVLCLLINGIVTSLYLRWMQTKGPSLISEPST